MKNTDIIYLEIKKRLSGKGSFGDKVRKITRDKLFMSFLMGYCIGLAHKSIHEKRKGQ